MSILECYKELGLLPNTDLESVKSTYRRLVKSCHPDLNPNNPNASILFNKLTLAYNTIIKNYTGTRTVIKCRVNNHCPNCGGVGYTLSKKKTPFGVVTQRIICPICNNAK